MADVDERIRLIIDALPIISTCDLMDTDDSCPICLMSFTSILLDNDPQAGVTKLVACNHMFCRKDLTQWIESRHGSCPTCRHSFLDIRPPSESDDESSDGGEYIPNEHEDDFNDEDDDDIFFDTDGFSDIADFTSEPMDLDLELLQGEDAQIESDTEDDDILECGLTEGELSSMSEEGDYTTFDRTEDMASDCDVNINNEIDSYGENDEGVLSDLMTDKAK